MSLKELTWEDKWENYVQYGQLKEPIVFDCYGNALRPELPDAETWAILSVMHQLKGKMSVYEASLKGVEFVGSSHGLNSVGAVKQMLIQHKKLEIKNLKKDTFFSEEVNDYYNALEMGYKKYLNVAESKQTSL